MIEPYSIRDTLQKSAFDVILKPHSIQSNPIADDAIPTPREVKNYSFKPYNDSFKTYQNTQVAEMNLSQYTPKQIPKSQYNFHKIQPNFRELLEADTAKPDFL
ncbi:MAG: hypothetical protein ACO3UU_13815, partial [Minisyncoccia bacterium]